MQINVVFTTQLKAILGKSSVAEEVPVDTTVGELVRSLAKHDAEAFATLVLDKEKQLLPSLLICVNDQQVEEATILQPGDTVTLLSAISGG